MCALEAIALVVLVTSSRARSARLVLAVGALMFGVMTLQPQIEAVAFGVIRPAAALRIGAMGLLIAAIVAPVAVLVCGRIRATEGVSRGCREPLNGGGSGASVWRLQPWRAIVSAAFIFVALYLLFGYFIAWQSAEVRAFYRGDNSSGFLSHIWALQLRVPWFLPLQFARGCLWAGLGVVGLGLMVGSWLRAGCIIGLFFAVVMNAQLLLPNPIMPEAVRMVHITETAPANFVLGVALAWLLYRRDARMPRR